MILCCPICREVHQFGDDSWLEVNVEIGYASSSGSSPNAFGIDGLCEPCAVTIFSDLANAIRARVGLPLVAMADDEDLKDYLPPEPTEDGP